MDIAILDLIEAFVAGGVLGTLYCAMLWFAVRRFAKARRPTLWLFATAAPRLAVPLAGFYWVMDGRWEKLMACLAGFILVRLVVQYRVRLPRAHRSVAS